MPDDESDTISKLRNFIATTPAVTLIGAAVKLRRLIDPVFDSVLNDDRGRLACVRSALATIDREIARTALRR